jgi:hypothetical protein
MQRHAKTRLGLIAGLATALSVVAMSSAAAPAPTYHVGETTKIGGEGGWDYLAYDPNTHYLFVTRVGGVLVEDVATKKSAGTIPAFAGTRVHGIALAPDLGIGFTGDGKDNTSTVFSLKDFKVLRRVDLGHGPMR